MLTLLFHLKSDFTKNHLITNDHLDFDYDVSVPCVFFVFYCLLRFFFIAIFILLTHRKATEALIHMASNYPDLLPQMPRYYCPVEIF